MERRRRHPLQHLQISQLASHFGLGDTVEKLADAGMRAGTHLFGRAIATILPLSIKTMRSAIKSTALASRE